jgi:anti-sigma B factor antagonist
MDLYIESTASGEAVDLVATGRIDAETAADLAAAVAEELRRGRHEIRLDLHAVTFLSSAGIRGLFETQRAARTAGATCFVSRASDPVRRVLDLTRLTPLLMGNVAAETRAAAGGGEAPSEEVSFRSVRLGPLARPSAAVLGRLVGSDCLASVGRPTGVRTHVARDGFALGLGALAAGEPSADRAGELVAACGAVFHRPPHSHASIDYTLPAGDLTAEIDMAFGLVWRGIPSGRAGFEPVDDAASVSLDELSLALLDVSGAAAIAFVVIADVAGLVGAELIRPLTDASPADSPRCSTRAVAARWISFSREPVYPRHTALLVGVACRDAGNPSFASFLRPIGTQNVRGHVHTAVFPGRPLGRAATDLTETVADLTGSTPDAVLHLLADPQPVLGSGRSELVRGTAWFAPLEITASPESRP